MGEKDRALLAHIPEMITISDPEGRVIYANPATERVSGFAPEEFVGRDPFETIHPEDRPRCEEAFEALLRTPGLSLDLEHRIRRKNGEWRWVEGTFVSLFDDPEVGGLLATVRDVAGRKRAGKELRLQARLLGAVGEAVVAVGADGRVSYWNRAAEKAYGWTAEEALGRPLGEMVVPEGLRGRAEEVMAAVSAGRRWSGTFEVLRKDGSGFTALATNEPVFDEDGALVGVICVFRDVTDRRRAEEALKESEERYRLIVEGARDYAIITTDPAGRIESWSPGAENIFGWSAAEVRGRPTAITFTPEDREAGDPEKELALAARDGSAPDVRWHLRKDGSCVFIDGTTRVLRGGEAGSPRGFLKVGQDTTERRRTQQALQASEQKYRTLVENVSDHAIFMLDPEGIVTEWTEGARRVKGYSADEVIGRHFSMFYTPEDVASGEPGRMLAQAASEGRAEREAWRVHKDGSRIWASEVVKAVRDAEGMPIGFTKISRDLTERHTLEEEKARLRDLELTARAEQAERERVSRELHDRVAHTMAVAHQSLELHGALAKGDPERAALKLEQARDATRTALEQTRHLSAQLARSGAQETKGGVSAALGDLLETHVPPGVESSLGVVGDESRVPSQVGEQAYLVMREAVRNAVEHSGCGRVEAYLEVDDEELRGRVEDDGSGFDPRDYPNEEEGTSPAGVGLLSMRERTERLGGRLDVFSGPGRGTTVEVRIPLTG